ncbi:MAG: hypothetical protein WBQ10_15660 [Terriglobales bacterium]
MIETDIDRRQQAAEEEDNERDAIVLGVFQEQSQFVPGSRSNLAMGGDQQYMVTDPVTGRIFVIKDTRVIRRADLAADIRRQLEEIRVALV